MKLAQKLLLIMVLCSLLPLIGAGIPSLIIAQNTLRNQILGQLGNTETHQIDRLGDLVDQANARLNNAAYKAQTRLLLQQYDQTHSPAIQKTLNQALNELLAGEATFKRIHLLDPSGKVVASTDASYLGRSYASTEVFQTGSKGQTSAIFFTDAGGEIRQYLAAPLQTGGQAIGTIVIEGLADQYLLVTGDYSELGRTGESYLTRKTASGQMEYLTPLRFKPAAALTPAVAIKNETDYRGAKVLSVSRQLQNDQWTLVSKIDQNEVEAPLFHLRDFTYLLLLLTAVAACLAAWYLAGFITRPIERFTEVVTQIRQGHLEKRIKITSRDEIGMLGSAFNEMTDSVLETRARLEASIGSLPFGFAVVNTKDQIVYHNEILGRLLDRTIPTDPAGTTVLLKEFSVTYDKIINLLHVLHDTQSKRKIIERTVELGPKYFRFLFVPVIKREGEADVVVGSVMTVEDLTETRAISRSRDEFFSIASHELRTPLTAIRGNASMILQYYADQLKDHDLHEMVSDIQDSSTHLIDIVNDFLDMSRLEQGRARFKPVPCDVEELIKKTLREYDVTSSRRKLYLKFFLAKKLPLVMVDPDRARQVIINLLGNALKFTEEGGVTIDAEVVGPNVKVTVTDTGQGIPEKTQHLLFHKFQQASDNILTRDDTQSTGLGLYISRMLAETMGGKLYLEHTEEDKGSTFAFELPIAKDAKAQPSVEKP